MNIKKFPKKAIYHLTSDCVYSSPKVFDRRLKKYWRKFLIRLQILKQVKELND